jgi:hypothetical protein
MFRKMLSVTKGLNGLKKINSIVFSNVLLQAPNPHPNINILRNIVEIMEPIIDIIILIFVGFTNSFKSILSILLSIFIYITLFV